MVYRGKNPVEYAADSIRAAEAAGMTIEYTTNNSSRFQHVVADQLKGFGLDVEPWQVITSSVVAARMVAKALPAGARVQVLGAEHLRDEVTRNGLTIVDGPQDRPQAVIQGWYPDMTWQMMADAAFAVEAGATYFVTNRDLTIPRELGIAPGCGSMIRAVITATGVEPVASAGKPEAYMYDEAIAPDLRELGEAQPEPVRDESGTWECRKASAWFENGQVHVSDPTSMDGLRAAVCAAWEAADQGAQLSEATVPVFAIEA